MSPNILGFGIARFRNGSRSHDPLLPNSYILSGGGPNKLDRLLSGVDDKKTANSIRSKYNLGRALVRKPARNYNHACHIASIINGYHHGKTTLTLCELFILWNSGGGSFHYSKTQTPNNLTTL